MREHAIVFGGPQVLVGVITEPPRSPETTSPLPVAIFLNAGVIHRVGPSRLYVGIARRLASIGWTSVRFDHSGIGDSPVRRDGTPFERSAILEVRQVMDWLQRSRGADTFVLVGLCSGAVTSFEAAVVDPRVVGAVMINPQGFDDDAAWNAYIQNRSSARRYWTRSLFSASSWWNALTGRVDYRRLVKVLWRQAAGAAGADGRVVQSVATRVATDLRRLLDRDARLLLLCSEGDDGIDYMNVIVGQDIRTMSGPRRPDVRILPDADHSFTLRAGQLRIVEEIRQWATATFVASRQPADQALELGESVAETVSFSV